MLEFLHVFLALDGVHQRSSFKPAAPAKAGGKQGSLECALFMVGNQRCGGGTASASQPQVRPCSSSA